VRVSLRLFPLCRTTPPPDQEQPGKSLPTVKLENPNFPGFGTVPLRSGTFLAPPALSLPLHWPLTTGHSSLTTGHSSEPLAFSKHTLRAALPHGRRADRFSHRIEKEHPQDPDIPSVRQDCPNLESVSGTWSLPEGTSAFALVIGDNCFSPVTTIRIP